MKNSNLLDQYFNRDSLSQFVTYRFDGDVLAFLDCANHNPFLCSGGLPAKVWLALRYDLIKFFKGV